MRRSHEREKEPAAGHSPGDGADRLQPGQAGRRVRAIRYRADFTYHEGAKGVQVVEDVKSRATRTREYAVKKKLLKDRFGIDITEV